MYDLSYKGIHRIAQLPITEGLSKPDIELKKFMSDPTIYEDDPRLPNFNKAWHEMGSRLWHPHIGDSWTEYRAPQPGSNVVIRAFREYPDLFREFLDLSSNPAVREDRPYYSEDDLKNVMGYAQRAYDMQWGKSNTPFTDEDIIFALEHFPYTYTKKIIESDGSALYLRPECSYTYGNVVVNQWLVHNSTNAHVIWETGFKYGAPISKLVNTSYTKKEESETSEYAFAFPIDEAPEPGKSVDDADEEDEEEEKEEDPDDIEYMDEEERKFRGKDADKFFKLRYGGNGCQSGSIVFVASGNQMFHHGDHEHQVMFNKNEPAGCFLITRFPLSSYMPKFKIPNHIRSIYRWTNHGIWFIYGNDKNRPLFMSKNYMDCLNWIKKNGATYASAMKRWKPGNVSPKKFESYLGTLPKSPLTEAVTALYEGLTKSDMALGKHLKSLDGGTPIQKPSKAVAGETQHQYVRLARKPKEIGAILSAGAKGDSEALANALKQYNSDEPQVDFTGAVKQLGRLFASVTDKEQLATAAKQFAGNDANSGYQTLQGINGFNLDLFVKSIRYGVEERKHDSDYMTMNPDAKQSRVMNKWLFHGTSLESAIQIAKHGFDRGNKVGDLAYNNSTGNGDMKHDYSGDYLFAFDAEDITDNRDECQNGKIYKTASYGPTKVMFKASGYKIYHHGDNENQVIFDYHEPDSCFLLIPKDKAKSVGMPVKQSQRDKWEEDYQVVGQGKDGKGKVLYAGNGLKPCIRWVVQNGDTYSKFMFKFH